MDNWTVTLKKNFSCKEPVFIEGLPGIGNVGKVVADYIIDKCRAKKVGILFSYDLPNSVFVTANGLVALPSLELYHFSFNNQDYLVLTGDAQPSSERASYELTEVLLSLAKDFSVKEIVTLGGIGLEELPESHEVFVTGNKSSFVKTFKESGANTKIFGVVGPIVGVSGLLLGLSKKISAAALLVETFAHPMYIGLKEAKVLLDVLIKQYGFVVDMNDLNEEIDLLEKEISGQDTTKDKPKKLKYGKTGFNKDINYIG